MRLRTCLLLPLAVGALSGCASALETRPGRTATEQIMLARAIEDAAAHLETGLRAGTPVHLRTAGVAGEGVEVAASALREQLLSEGLRLVSLPEAEVVIEVRLSVLSFDQMNRVLGVPRLTLPVSPALTTVTVPELSLYSRRERAGVAEFAAFAYDARTGSAIPLRQGAMAGATRITSHTAGMVLSWGVQQLPPRGKSVARPLSRWSRSWHGAGAAGAR